MTGLSDFNLTVVQTLDNGQTLYMDACCTQLVASMLESLFDDESHACQFGSRLLNQVENTFGRITVGQKIVNKQHFVAGAKKIATDTDIVCTLFGKRKN